MTNSPNHTTAHAAHTGAGAGAPARPGRGLRIAGWLTAAALTMLMIKWVLVTAVLLAVPFALWWVIDRAGQGRRQRAAETVAAEHAAKRRIEVESRAVVDAAGGCGWCGSRIAHRDHATGGLVMPADFHRDEIERTIAA